MIITKLLSTLKRHLASTLKQLMMLNSEFSLQRRPRTRLVIAEPNMTTLMKEWYLQQWPWESPCSIMMNSLKVKRSFRLYKRILSWLLSILIKQANSDHRQAIDPVLLPIKVRRDLDVVSTKTSSMWASMTLYTRQVQRYSPASAKISLFKVVKKCYWRARKDLHLTVTKENILCQTTSISMYPC